MKNVFKMALLSVALCAQLLAPALKVNAASTIYDNKTGTQDGYDYELWKDSGNTSMTLNEGGAFNCQWSNIGNALFRKGKKFDSTKTYQQIGNISFDYGCDYKPNGNSYLCVYGWTKDPMIEYYIVDSWGSWRPPGGSPKGQIQVDGGTYDVYEATRVNQPSIEGNKTFKQYFSVRTEKRTSGTISVTEHFKAWEKMGMKLGKIYEAALNVEGYQSSGSANVYKNNMTVGGASSNNNNGNTGNNNGGNKNNGNNSGNNNANNNNNNSNNNNNNNNNGWNWGNWWGNWNNNNNNNSNNNNKNNGNNGGGSAQSSATVQCESMSKSGQYAGNISSPFNGVALYANNDKVSFTQNFSSDTSDFTLRGCSNNSQMARVDLKIGGQTKGTFYYGGSYPAEYTIKNVKHGTGNQTVELVLTADNGQWDAYIDYLKFNGGSGNASANNGEKKNTNNNNNANNNNKNNNANNNQANNASQPKNNNNTANQKIIALTFDDGPTSTTNEVLDVLQKYNVKATFFLIGQNINQNTINTMKRQVNMGCELASHSYTHEDMSRMNAQQVKDQQQRTAKAIKDAVGVDVKFFRPPYISISNTMYQNIDVPFIQGTMHNDWMDNTSASQRAQSVLNGARDGQIVLLHDFQGNSKTVQALPQIIEGLQKQGYTFVTVSELFQMKGVNPNVEYKIWSATY
jgi:peptidoglycan/xylan/chitin deacetylase (PgdA/CDA1 family)